jgi:methionyl-tRNA formyltransferase
MRVIFCGTAAFAVPSLRALAREFEVALVVTQQDRPSGRGRKFQMPPVKQAAIELDLPVTQPQSIRKKPVVAELASVTADIIVVAAYGKIIPPSILTLPPHGCLNVHASLLPRHRGAAPVTAAILAGDEETGVTIMQMDAGLDTGPMLRQQSLPLTGEETTASLTQALADLGADILIPAMSDWAAGRISPQVQDEARATYAPLLKKEDGIIPWQRGAHDIDNHVRAMQPWPGAVTYWHGRQLKILRARTGPGLNNQEPGTVIRHENGLAVVAGTGTVIVDEVQIAGKRPMPAADFLRGNGSIVGAILRGASMVS